MLSSLKLATHSLLSTLSAVEHEKVSADINAEITKIINNEPTTFPLYTDSVKAYILANPDFVKTNLNSIIEAYLNSLSMLKAFFIEYGSDEDSPKWRAKMREIGSERTGKFINFLQRIGIPEEEADDLEELFGQISKEFLEAWGESYKVNSASAAPNLPVLSAVEHEKVSADINAEITKIINNEPTTFPLYTDSVKVYILANPDFVKTNLNSIIEAYLNSLSILKAFFIEYGSDEDSPQWRAKLREIGSERTGKFINFLQRIGIPEEEADDLDELFLNISEEFLEAWGESYKVNSASASNIRLLSAVEHKKVSAGINAEITKIINNEPTTSPLYTDSVKAYILANPDFVKTNLNSIIKAYLNSISMLKAFFIVYGSDEGSPIWRAKLRAIGSESTGKFINFLQRIGIPEEEADDLNELFGQISEEFLEAWGKSYKVNSASSPARAQAHVSSRFFPSSSALSIFIDQIGQKLEI